MDQTDPLAQDLESLGGALRNLPVILYKQDRQLRYTWIFNPFPGFSETDMLGKTDADLFLEEEARQILFVKESVLEQGEAQSEVLNLTLQGEPHAYQWMVHPLTAENGECIGITGLAVEWQEPVGSTGRLLPGETRERLLASLSRTFAETGTDYPMMLETVTRLVGRAAGDTAAIWDWEAIQQAREDSRSLLPATFSHAETEAEEALQELFTGMPLALAEKLFEQVAQGRGMQRVDDLLARPDLLEQLPDGLRQWLNEYPIHAMLLLPLRTPRGVIGLLMTGRAHSKMAYTADDQLIWQDVADQAALAIENARLYSEEVHRNRQLNALHDATTALLSTLDLEELLGRILDAAQQAIPMAERGILYLVAPRTGRLEVRATSGFNDPRIRRTGLMHNSHANRAMRERRPLLIRDTALLPNENGDGEHEEFGVEVIRSAIFAPLLLSDELLGTLSLSSSYPRAFNQSDLQLLVSFAATTTAALHNAMLHSELQRIAITDPLTGLYNRRGLLELGRHEVERFQRFGQPISAIMLDIDHFKDVNDTYGHLAGDQVLCELAERCRLLIRLVDIIGRYGGEEYAIVLPETDLFQASAIAERLRIAVEEKTFYTDQGKIPVTISLGVSRAGHGLTSLTELIEQADAALYRAKQNGRNRVEIG